MSDIQKEIDALADLLPAGHLQSVSGSADFIRAARHEIERQRSVIEAARKKAQWYADFLNNKPTEIGQAVGCAAVNILRALDGGGE